MHPRDPQSVLDRLLYVLADHAVRDLAWVIGSPTLVDACHAPFADRTVDDAFCRAALADAETWIRDLDRDPTPLHVFLDRHHSHRLGHYFESLIEFWLHRAGATNLRARLQVPEPGEGRGACRGEFDFVFGHPRWGDSLHWEAAVKFYLQAAADPRWDAFVGPNPADRLADKLHALYDRQLLLGGTAAGRAALGGESAPAARAFVKGYLFFPAGTAPMDVPGLSRAGLRGWWLRHGETPLPTHAADARWKILPRLAWLAPARAAAGDRTCFDTAHLQTILARHFAHAQAPLLLAELTEGGDGVWREIARGFVVSPTWPREAGAA